MLAEAPEDDHGQDEREAGHAEAQVIGLAQGVDVSLREAPQAVQGHGRILALGQLEEGRGVGQLALEELVGQGRDAGVVGQSGPAHDPVAHGRGGRGSEHGPDVDAHVEDVEGPVAHGPVLGIVIEVADQGLQVALEQAGAQGDHGQGGDDQAEARVHRRGQGQQEITREHDDQAQRDGLAVTQEAVGQEAAQKREDVDADQEGGVHGAGRGRRHSILGLHEQDEDGDHGVVAEALAHVGEEGHE